MHFFLRTKYYFTNKFDREIIDNTDKNTIIIYRNYNKKININEIIKLKNFSKKKRKKIYLSNNVQLALKLNLDGVYIPSFNHSLNHLAFSFKKDFDLIGSAHNLKEIRIKEKQKVNKIFISSLFKKNKNYLGINKIKIISNYTKKKIVLLGGISNKNFKKLNLLNSSEFAGISFFEQKKGP
tara:strand:- start:4 stop:546 length:543 start_codon:yes stop_codon:yes gene_type:complete